VPPLYCLNLPSSTDRRRRMERRLAHHGLLERTRFVSAYAPPAESESPENASRACFGTHLKALREFLAAGEREAIICEDDVLRHNDCAERLAEVLANLPGGASLCLLGYLIERWDTGYVWSGRFPERENLCRIIPWWVMGSQMYWISRAYARTVLDRYDGIPLLQLPPMTEEITATSDGYLCHPPLALEEALDSTIRPAPDMEFHLRAVRQWPYEEYSAGEEGQDVSPLARTPTIALCMIVRDESAVIERCLASV